MFNKKSISGVISVVLVVVVMLVFAHPALAATLIVTKLADTNDGSCDLVDCSLREAIAAAAAGDTITFSSGLSGAITLGSELAINKNLTITGPTTTTITVSGNNAVTVFNVATGVNLTLSNLTIANGRGTASIASAIHAHGGAGTTLTLNNVIVRNSGYVNSAIYVWGSRLVVNNSTFSNNTCSCSGGAIYVDASLDGLSSINGSTFSNNAADAEGGAILNFQSVLTINNSSFTGNHAGNGGAIVTGYSGGITVNGSTFTNNSATNGGAIHNSTSVTINDSTITTNTASANGGGIYNAGSATIINSTIASNSAADGGNIRHAGGTTLQNTIVANSVSSANCNSALTDGGNNLQYPGASCGGSIPTADPKLAPLQDNGGGTLTMALQPGSPAIDAGNNTVCAAAPVNNVDQRGVLRPIDGNGDNNAVCDIGAYEARPLTVAFATTYNVNENGSLTAGWTVTGNAGDYLGSSTATAGDVNGDGYADVIVGVHNYNGGIGRVFVYAGSATGLSATPIFTAAGESAGSHFGGAVNTAGDVNGDGYADIVVGAANYNNIGKAYVYLGGPAGINPTPAWTASPGVYEFGATVSTAGDVNGDGYSDVIIGTHGEGGNRGWVYLYLGGPSGLNSTPALILTGENTGDYFGNSASAAGDVNSDGYSDVIIGAPAYPHEQRTGKAYLYLGSAAGLNATPARTWTGQNIGDFFGFVNAAGDVNDDGYADVIVGAIQNYSGSTGKAYLYLGNAGSVSATPAITLTGENNGDLFGYQTGTAGDINGDGYADFLVSGRGYASNTGRVYLYLGSAGSLSATPVITLTGETASDEFGYSAGTAGDVNGDGYDDFMVGAYNYNAGDGRAYLYYSHVTAPFSVGEAAGSATITVTLRAASALTVTVAYATSNGTASAGSDYTAANGTLTFAPGQIAQTFSVSVTNDTLYETNETVTLTLSSPSNAVLGMPSMATLTILDDDPPPNVQFSAATYSVNENGGSATITATLNTASGLTVTVAYSTTNGTAIAGSDYDAISGTLTFNPGQITQTFSVPITNDTLDETNETVTLTLSSPSNAVLGMPSTATLTILDDDPPPTVQFSAATYSVNENGGSATITATLNTASGLTVTVAYAASNGTASAGSDYTAANGTLTFAPGQITQTFNVSVTNDTLDETNETVTLTLSSPISATLGSPNPATLTILDDDAAPAVAFSAASYSISENGGSATITATLNTASGLTVTVAYTTSNGTAVAGSDYLTASGVLTFTPGVITQSFTVVITDDTMDENNETVILTLSNPVNATLGVTNPVTLTIIDTTPTPTVQFSSAAYSVNENNSPATITVTLSSASSFTITVNYTSSNGMAIVGSDYLTASGVLTFAPGVVTRTFTVVITDDAVYEPDETATLTLSGAVSATLGSPNPATLTIVNNDPLPSVRFSSAAYSVNENSGLALITVTLSSASSFTVTVNYATSNGTAIAGSDYLTAGGVLTFAPGVTTRTFTVVITDDALVESNETVTLTLSGAVSATLGTPNPATLTIVENDVPQVRFSSAAYSVNENSGSATITVTLSSASSFTITVNYATSNGTATAGSDYLTAGGVLTFAPGQTSRTFTVVITNDVVVEPNETVTLTLSGAVSATLGTPNPATLTIVENDVPLVQFSSAAYSVNENGGSATITVTLSVAPAFTATVNYTSSNGTASAGSDYLTASGVLTFAPGQTSRTFTVVITDDALVESNETVTLTLSSPSNATLGSPNPATLTIVDNDVPTVQFSNSAYSVNENAGVALIDVTLSAAAPATVTVNYATSNGTAVAPGDYLTASGVLTFAPGVVIQTFMVTINEDTLAESAETIILTLNNPVGATLSVSNPVTLTITDNDMSGYWVYLPVVLKNMFPPREGHWTGATSFSQPMSFDVLPGGGRWANFKLRANFVIDQCSGTLEKTVTGTGDIISSQFGGSNGAFSFSGQFTTPAAANGSFSFVNEPTSCGPLTQIGIWTAAAP